MNTVLTFVSLSGMPDAGASILEPVWERVQRKARIIGGRREADSRFENSQGVVPDGHGGLP